MVNSEIKEVVYIAISLFLAGMILTSISMFVHLRDSMAVVRNNEIQIANETSAYREFNKYNDTIVYGDDIIEAIRNYYDTDVRVYVNSISPTNGGSYYIEKNLTNIKSLTDITQLQNLFNTNVAYRAYLVFDLYDKTSIVNVKVPMYNSKITSEVTAIKFIRL